MKQYIEDPVCPQCSKIYPKSTKFCATDGSELVRFDDLIPKCTICNTHYSENIKICPTDGGDVRIVFKQDCAKLHRDPCLNPQFEIPFKYSKAHSFNRFLAFLIDIIISTALLVPSIILLFMAVEKIDFESGKAYRLFTISFLLFLIPLTYTLMKDGLSKGQSWGKKVLGLMVVNLDDNTPCDKERSCLRNLISSLITIIPFVGWLIEPIMVLATRGGRKIGDKTANTQVIETKNFRNKQYALPKM